MSTLDYHDSQIAHRPVIGKTPLRALLKLIVHPLILLAMAYGVGNGLRFLTIHNTEWDQVYMRAARQLLEGKDDLYHATKQMSHVFTYPPFMALLAVPFSFLPHFAGRFAWFFINAIAVTMLCQWSWILSSGPRLIGNRVPRQQYLVLFLGLLCAIRFIQDGIDHQQTDLVIGALLIGGCIAMSQSRYGLAATAIGVAAAMKCTPLLFVGYFLWRGRWSAAAWLIVVAVGCNLLPNLVSSPSQHGWWLVLWFQNLIRPMGDANFRPGDWFSSVIFNQSISGAAYRFFVTTWSVDHRTLKVTDRAGAMDARTLKQAIYAFEGMLLLWSLIAFSRSRRNRIRAAGTPPILSLEYSAVLLLMLLLSPMSSKPHFCTMLLPGFCLARLAIERSSRSALICVIISIAVGNVVIPNFFGSVVGDIGLWYGLVTWSALSLLIGCYIALARGDNLSPEIHVQE